MKSGRKISGWYRLLAIVVLIGATAQALAACAVANSPAPSKAAGRLAEDIALIPVSPLLGFCYGISLGHPCFMPSTTSGSQPESWRSAISPDGSEVTLVKGGTLVVYDVNQRKWASPALSGHGRVTDVVFSPDHLHAAISTTCSEACPDGGPSNRVAILDLPTKRIERDIPLVHGLGGVAFSPNGTQIVMTSSCDAGCSEDAGGGRITLFALSENRIVQDIALPDHISAGRPIFAPDGRRVAFVTICIRNCPIGFRWNRIAILDLAAHDNPGTLEVADLRYTSSEEKLRSDVHFSADSKFLMYRINLLDSGTSQKIAIVDLDGPNNFRERVLQGEGFNTVYPAGFAANGDAVFMAMGPHGEMAQTLKDKLAEIDPKEGALTTVAMVSYAVSATSENLVPHINENFGRIETGVLTCAADCSKVVFVARRDLHERQYNYELFFAENGTARQVTNLSKGGSPGHLDDFSADGRKAIVDVYTLDVGNVPTIVDIATGNTIPLPVSDFDKLVPRTQAKPMSKAGVSK